MNTNMQPKIIDHIVIYNTVKNNRKVYLKTHFSVRSKKRPWYMLTKGKCKNYEERVMSWGACVDYFKVDSEIKRYNKRTTNKQMGRAAFMESMAQYKLEKWIRKHPAPCDENDLFKKEFLDPWKEERDKALERFRDVVVSIYDKTVVPFNRNKSMIVPVIKLDDYTYSYPNMNPLTIGYPLCSFVNKKFVSKKSIESKCKEILMKIKGTYDVKSIDYRYENKVLLSIAA